MDQDDDSCGIRGAWVYLLKLLLYEIITNREHPFFHFLP